MLKSRFFEFKQKKKFFVKLINNITTYLMLGLVRVLSQHIKMI